MSVNSYISIYNRSGAKLTEIVAPCARSWMIGQFGTCEFVVPGSHSQFNRQNFAFRNPVVVKTPGLPVWGGFLWPGRDWLTDESVVIRGRSPELVLGLRNSPGLSGSTSSVFQSIIELTNAVEDTLIRLGTVADNILSFTNIARPPSNLFQALNEIIDASGMEYEIVPVESQGQLTFTMNLQERFNRSITDFALQEGYNMRMASGSSALTEQGPIFNDVTIYRNNGAGGYNATYFASDAASQSEFGLAQTAITVEEESQLSDTAVASAFITAHKQPGKVFALEVFDRTEHGTTSTFDYLRLGNEISLKFSRVGFNASGGRGMTTTARIVGISYSDYSNTCHVAVEEIHV